MKTFLKVCKKFALIREPLGLSKHENQDGVRRYLTLMLDGQFPRP